MRPAVVSDFNLVNFRDLFPTEKVFGIVHPAMRHKKGCTETQLLKQRRHHCPVRLNRVVESEHPYSFAGRHHDSRPGEDGNEQPKSSPVFVDLLPVHAHLRGDICRVSDQLAADAMVRGPLAPRGVAAHEGSSIHIRR